MASTTQMIRTLFLAIGLAGFAKAASVYLVQRILLPPGQFQPMNLSLTNDGRFISYTYNSVTAAFDYLLWDGHSFQSVTSYDDGIRNYFEPAAMNQKGQMIGIAGTRVGSAQRNRIPVVRQVDGTFMPLRLPSGAINSFVSAISDTAGVLGVLNIGGQFQPFIWPSLSAEPTPVGTAGNLQAMGGLNIEGTYSLGIASQTEFIVQNGVTHDTGVSPNRFFPVNNNNQTLLEGASAKSYFWNGASVVPLPGLYALALKGPFWSTATPDTDYGPTVQSIR